LHDLRDDILKSVANRKVTAVIIADDNGIVAETAVAAEEARKLGLDVEHILTEGSRIKKGDEVARLCGTPKQIAIAEDVLIGIIVKPSGIASAANEFIKRAGQRPQIVCGALKKMPVSQKEAIRRAVVTGGAYYRISRDPFIYLDKNYIQMLGGIREGLKAVSGLGGYLKVVQIKGRNKAIVLEACEAVECGADILFIDTGILSDVAQVVKRLNQLNLRKKVKIAFGGNVTLDDIDVVKDLDIDVLDIGRQIIDAPLLDMRLEVVDVKDP
jgi:nicotinate-nucleotide pyrophosphorylase (carboxylating)